VAEQGHLAPLDHGAGSFCRSLFALALMFPPKLSSHTSLLTSLRLGSPTLQTLRRSDLAAALRVRGGGFPTRPSSNPHRKGHTPPKLGSHASHLLRRRLRRLRRRRRLAFRGLRLLARRRRLRLPLLRRRRVLRRRHLGPRHTRDLNRGPLRFHWGSVGFQEAVETLTLAASRSLPAAAAAASQLLRRACNTNNNTDLNSGPSRFPGSVGFQEAPCNSMRLKHAPRPSSPPPSPPPSSPCSPPPARNERKTVS
jgi:hypothetical protein